MGPGCRRRWPCKSYECRLQCLASQEHYFKVLLYNYIHDVTAKDNANKPTSLVHSRCQFALSTFSHLRNQRDKYYGQQKLCNLLIERGYIIIKRERERNTLTGYFPSPDKQTEIGKRYPNKEGNEWYNLGMPLPSHWAPLSSKVRQGSVMPYLCVIEIIYLNYLWLKCFYQQCSIFPVCVLYKHIMVQLRFSNAQHALQFTQKCLFEALGNWQQLVLDDPSDAPDRSFGYCGMSMEDC